MRKTGRTSGSPGPREDLKYEMKPTEKVTRKISVKEEEVMSGTCSLTRTSLNKKVAQACRHPVLAGNLRALHRDTAAEGRVSVKTASAGGECWGLGHPVQHSDWPGKGPAEAGLTQSCFQLHLVPPRWAQAMEGAHSCRPKESALSQKITHHPTKKLPQACWSRSAWIGTLSAHTVCR